jgi:hypothetical protein
MKLHAERTRGVIYLSRFRYRYFGCLDSQASQLS